MKGKGIEETASAGWSSRQDRDRRATGDKQSHAARCEWPRPGRRKRVAGGEFQNGKRKRTPRQFS